MHPGGRSDYRLSGDAQNCLIIAFVKDAHACPLKEDSKHFGIGLIIAL